MRHFDPDELPDRDLTAPQEPPPAVEYRPVPGYPAYRVGSDGSVWPRFKWGGRSTTTDQWRRMNPADAGNGYLCVNLSVGRKKTLYTVHRIILLAFVGPCPEGMECLHADGNRKNNELSNLSWGTRAQNVADSIRHGTFATGLQRGPRIPPAMIVAISRAHAEGKSSRTIAKETGTSATTALRVASKGKPYDHAHACEFCGKFGDDDNPVGLVRLVGCGDDDRVRVCLKCSETK